MKHRYNRCPEYITISTTFCESLRNRRCSRKGVKNYKLKHSIDAVSTSGVITIIYYTYSLLENLSIRKITEHNPQYFKKRYPRQ